MARLVALLFAAYLVPNILAATIPCNVFASKFLCNSKGGKDGCAWIARKCRRQTLANCGQCSGSSQCMVRNPYNGFDCQNLPKSQCQNNYMNQWCGDQQWVAYSYRIDHTKPNFVARAYPILQLTPDTDIKVAVGSHEAKASTMVSSSCSETASKISTSLGVSAKYLGFSGSVKASYESLHVRKGSHMSVEYKVTSEMFSLTHDIGLNPAQKVDPQVINFFASSSPEQIVKKLGQFYATQAYMGGVFSLRQIQETASDQAAQAMKASFHASGDWVVASFKASGKASSASSSNWSSMQKSSTYMALGGNSRLWLDLGYNGANLNQIQSNWAASVTEDNLYPTRLRLVPIWELFQGINPGKAAAVKQYLTSQWKTDSLALQSIDVERIQPGRPACACNNDCHDPYACHDSRWPICVGYKYDIQWGHCYTDF